MNQFLKTLIVLTLIGSCASKEKNPSPDVIRKVLVKNIPKMRGCLEKEMRLSGKKVAFQARLKFKILKDGSVSDTTILIDPNNERTSSAAQCVGQVLNKLKFPKPTDGGFVEVDQPINFYPKNKK